MGKIRKKRNIKKYKGYSNISLKRELLEGKEKKEIREINRDTLILKPFKSSKEQLIAIEKYRKYNEWLQEKEHKYQDQIIAILEDEKKENWEIIAHADSKKELDKKLDEYFEMHRDTSDKYLILFIYREIILIPKFNIKTTIE